MSAPFPFDAWAKPGKDAFDFWISFFPTAPLFGVEWRFGEMMNPAMNPLMQVGPMAVVVPFPGMRAAGAAARPGEFDSPAAADERAARPVATAADAAAGAAADAGRVAAETGKAVARSAGQTMKAGGAAAAETTKAGVAAASVASEQTAKTGATAAKMASAAQKRASSAAAVPGPAAGKSEGAAPAAANGADKTPRTGGKAPADHKGEAPEQVAEIAAKAGDAAAGKLRKGDAVQASRKAEAERAEAKGEARAAAPLKAATAVETARPAAAKSAGAPDEVVDAAIAAGPKPKVLFSKRPAEVDDLKTLKGVGPGLEKQLNDLGVWRLDQIAKMSDPDLVWIDANLTTFKGRCFRDDWVGQAKSRLGR